MAASSGGASFLLTPPDSEFPLANLPWGVFSERGASSPSASRPRIGVALGDSVVDVGLLQRRGLLSGPLWSRTPDALQGPTLNALMGLGRGWWQEARATLQRLLSAEEGVLRDDAQLRAEAIVPVESVAMHLPAAIGDYTDFYASKEHATNVGRMFRGPGSELNPNWLHLPVAYHGRASSIVVSGAGVRRPMGQVLPKGAAEPVLAPCNALDFELEMGAFIGAGNALGECISVEEAWREHVFGLVLMNDWSARDVQKWEYVPLGPFNGKNWATQISPWVVTTDALALFMGEAPAQAPPVLPYLQEGAARARSMPHINLQVDVVPQGCAQPSRVSSSNLKYMYWSFAQMVAHHTVGGCNLRPGDLLGTGTISGRRPHELGSLLELTQGGTQPLRLGAPGCGPAGGAGRSGPEGGGGGAAEGGEDRGGGARELGYLQDGDEVVLSGSCSDGRGLRVGFGECRGRVLPARTAAR